MAGWVDGRQDGLIFLKYYRIYRSLTVIGVDKIKSNLDPHCTKNEVFINFTQREKPFYSIQ